MASNLYMTPMSVYCCMYVGNAYVYIWQYAPEVSTYWVVPLNVLVWNLMNTTHGCPTYVSAWLIYMIITTLVLYVDGIVDDMDVDPEVTEWWHHINDIWRPIVIRQRGHDRAVSMSMWWYLCSSLPILSGRVWTVWQIVNCLTDCELFDILWTAWHNVNFLTLRGLMTACELTYQLLCTVW